MNHFNDADGVKCCRLRSTSRFVVWPRGDADVHGPTSEIVFRAPCDQPLHQPVASSILGCESGRPEKRSAESLVRDGTKSRGCNLLFLWSDDCCFLICFSGPIIIQLRSWPIPALKLRMNVTEKKERGKKKVLKVQKPITGSKMLKIFVYKGPSNAACEKKQTYNNL